MDDCHMTAFFCLLSPIVIIILVTILYWIAKPDKKESLGKFFKFVYLFIIIIAIIGIIVALLIPWKCPARGP